MSEEIEDSNIQEATPADARLSFLTDPKKHNLSKMLKSLDKNVEQAIEMLVNVMNNDENDIKIRVECAKEIINKKVAISTEINKEMLSRTIAESRLILASRAAKMKTVTNSGEDDDDAPVPMFVPNMIVDHSKIKEM